MAAARLAAAETLALLFAAPEAVAEDDGAAAEAAGGGPPAACKLSSRTSRFTTPLGVVTVMSPASAGSREQSILYPGGRKVLKPGVRVLARCMLVRISVFHSPWINAGWPWKSADTRSMTPGVSMLGAM